MRHSTGRQRMVDLSVRVKVRMAGQPSNKKPRLLKLALDIQRHVAENDTQTVKAESGSWPEIENPDQLVRALTFVLFVAVEKSGSEHPLSPKKGDQ